MTWWYCLKFKKKNCYRPPCVSPTMAHPQFCHYHYLYGLQLHTNILSEIEHCFQIVLQNLLLGSYPVRTYTAVSIALLDFVSTAASPFIGNIPPFPITVWSVFIDKTQQKKKMSWRWHQNVMAFCVVFTDDETVKTPQQRILIQVGAKTIL